LPVNVVDKKTGIDLVLIVPDGGAPENRRVETRDSWWGRGNYAPFYIGRYRVCQREWNAVMGAESDADVDQLCWDDAEKFLRKTGFRAPTQFEWVRAYVRAGVSVEVEQMDGTHYELCADVIPSRTLIGRGPLPPRATEDRRVARLRYDTYETFFCDWRPTGEATYEQPIRFLGLRVARDP
jgi:hypothetical protein